MHTGTDFDTIKRIVKEINSTIKVKMIVSLHSNYYGWPEKWNVITKNKIKKDEINGSTLLLLNSISKFISYLIDSLL